MGGEGIIAAVVGALAGGGGVGALRRLLGPDARYYREVIEGLQSENRELHQQLRGLRERVTALELAQDQPPGYLG